MEDKHVRSWLKAIVSLVVVMGLTWIIGVLIVARKELVPLAYIYTTMVAFQGVWIFVIFVVVDKKVREVFSTRWRSQIKESRLFNAKSAFSTNVVCNNNLFSNVAGESYEVCFHGL